MNDHQQLLLFNVVEVGPIPHSDILDINSLNRLIKKELLTNCIVRGVKGYTAATDKGFDKYVELTVEYFKSLNIDIPSDLNELIKLHIETRIINRVLDRAKRLTW
jgi:hypothetical protein